VERISLIVSQFTFARRGACYPPGAGDFRGPVIGAAGTRHFEPDGVVFSRSSLSCPIPPTGDGEWLAVAGCGLANEHRSRDRFSDSPFPLKPCSGTLDPRRF
jgi:hypothetical protein